MYELIFKKPAKKFLKKLDKSIQERILEKLNLLNANPKLGKPLIGNMAGFWSLRIGKIRVLYQISESELIIYVMNVGHRKSVY